MSYIHWKKFALALTALFWASCTSDSPTVVQPAYGVVCPPEGCGTPEITSSSSGTSHSPNIGASSSSLTKPVSRDKLTACTLKSYIYDTVECGHNTTTANNFYCKDGFECLICFLIFASFDSETKSLCVRNNKSARSKALKGSRKLP